MEERHRVLIPVVGSDPTKNQFIEVYTKPYTFGDDASDLVSESRALDKDWERVVAHLRQAKLYHAGCVAVGAVRKLGLPKPKLALYQWLKPQAWLERQRVYVYPEDIPIEGHSAELGLALLLFIGASHSTAHRLVIATGALSRQVIQAQDVKVLPVSQLAEKCELIIRYVRQNPSQKILFFTPCYDEANNAVERMPEIQALRDLGVTVLSIDRLSEAVKALKIKHTGYLLYDRVLQGLIAVFTTIFLVIGLYWLLWCQRAIEMDYVPGDAAMTRREPFLVCSEHYQTINRQGITPIIPIGSTLGWKLKVGNQNGFDTWLSKWFNYRGYYIARILIRQYSEPKVKIYDGNGKLTRVRPGETWEWSWTLGKNQEELKALVLVAQRYPFNPVEIKKTIQQFRKVKKPQDEMETDITAAVNFIFSRFHSGLKFVFQMVDKPNCTL